MSPDASTPDRDALDELVLACLDRYDAEGAGAIDELCGQHPDSADALRRRMARLLSTGLVDDQTGESFPERLGDFRLIQRLGGGGMGVVYLAEQESLGREVALKLIRPDQLYFPDARQRFRREVELVARLQHPAVVPVYTFGEENGLPYFAMERIRGCTLAQVLLELGDASPRDLRGADLAHALAAGMRRAGLDPEPAAAPLFEGTWAEACLTIARDIGAALDHAHRQGVLHRDVKPSNVLLTPAGRALLFDFGLSSGDRVATITRSGAQLGSLPYMAPEQLEHREGVALDRRTDVYQLGAMLRELLTLRRPFLGLGLKETRQAIQRGGLGELSAREARAVGAPRDAGVVIGKATARSADERYASAADLVRDLDNVLSLRPIEARAAGPLLRLRRAAQRHPERAGFAALVAVVLLVGPLAFGIQQSLANRKTTAALVTAEDERLRAEGNLDTALDAVLVMLAEVGDETLADVPGMNQKQLDLLLRAGELYDELLRQRPDDGGRAVERARIRRETANVLEDLGQVAEADAEYERAIATLRAFLGRADVPDVRRQLAAALGNRTKTLQALHRGEEARDGAVEGLTILEELAREARDGPTRAQVLRDLTSMRHMLGEWLRLEDRFDEAQAIYDDAVESARELLALEGRTPGALMYLGDALCESAVLRDARGQLEDADLSFREGAELLRESVALDPRASRARSELAIALGNHCTTLSGMQQLERAEVVAEEGIALLDELVREFPARTDFRQLRLHLLSNLAVARLETGETEEALPVLRALVRGREQLCAELPASREAKKHLAMSLFNLANLAAELGHAVEACEVAGRACQIYRDLHAASPTDRAIASAYGYALLLDHSARARRHEPPDFARAEADTLRLCPQDSTATVVLGGLAGLAHAATLTDPSLSDEEREERAADLFDRTLGYLEQAFTEGFSDFARLGGASEFDSIRELPGYGELLAHYRD